MADSSWVHQEAPIRASARLLIVVAGLLVLGWVGSLTWLIVWLA